MIRAVTSSRSIRLLLPKKRVQEEASSWFASVGSTGGVTGCVDHPAKRFKGVGVEAKLWAEQHARSRLWIEREIVIAGGERFDIDIGMPTNEDHRPACTVGAS